MNNVLDFGAVGDGVTDCTDAVQRAIDAAAAAGGGRVYFPAGEYLSRTLYLKSGCVLRLEAGARLVASTDYTTYGHPRRKPLWCGGVGNPPWSQYWAFIAASGAENIGIEGEGVIDGRGKFGVHFPNESDPERRRPFLVVFDHCSRCFLRGITLQDPAAYSFLGIDVRQMDVTGIRILSAQSGNGDGIDFDGCQDVIISGCYVDAGDDAISLKTTKRGEPCERVTVTGCILKSKWAAVRLGTESAEDMRDITVTGCVFSDCRDGLKIQSCGGAVYENMVFSSITMRRVIRPFFLTANRFRMSTDEEGARPAGSALRRLLFSDIAVDMPPGGEQFDMSGLVVCGTEENEAEDLVFRNVNVVLYGGEMQKNLDVPPLYDYTQLYPEIIHFGKLPACGFYVRHAKGVVFDGCRFRLKNADARPVFFCDNASVVFSGCDCGGQTAVQAYESAVNGMQPQPLSAEDAAALQASHARGEEYRRFAEEAGKNIDAALAMKNQKSFAYAERIALPPYKKAWLVVCTANGVTVGAGAEEISVRVPGDYFWFSRVAVPLPQGLAAVTVRGAFEGAEMQIYWE